MPYKDLKARRDYQRGYKSRQKQVREAQAQTTRKAYLCTRYPDLQIGGKIRLRGGFYVTACREEQQTIETSREFGTLIVAWEVEPVPGLGNDQGRFIL